MDFLKRWDWDAWVRSLGVFNLTVLGVVFPYLLYQQRFADPLCGEPLINHPLYRANLYVVLGILIWAACLASMALYKKQVDAQKLSLLTILLNFLAGILLVFATRALKPAIFWYWLAGLVLILFWREHAKKTAFYIACVSGLIVLSPHYVGPYDCASVSSVKANMSTLQTIVEIYGEDHQGMFPESVQVLQQEATTHTNAYWKDFRNPLTWARGKNGSFGDLKDYFFTQNLEPPRPKITDMSTIKKPYVDILGIRFITYTNQLQWQNRGVVLYHRLSPKAYRIYATGAWHYHLLSDKGKVLYLSNKETH